MFKLAVVLLRVDNKMSYIYIAKKMGVITKNLGKSWEKVGKKIEKICISLKI